MKQKAILIILGMFLCINNLSAQNRSLDSIQHLGEIVLLFSKLKDSVYTTNQIVLNDSILRRNQASLTSLLNFNSSIYLKENGLGMVSSPSFRGTTAQQTAVLWNGININSQTTGQTDFNTINTQGYDNIVVKPGGGGVVDGNNAIGGSIYLENELDFNKGFQNDIFLKYGEFNTYNVNFKTAFSDAKNAVSVAVNRNASDNDYPYPNSDLKNENGQFHTTNIALVAGRKLSDKSTLNIYSNIYDGKRNFSLPTPNALPTKYYDFNTRSMVEWQHANKSFLHETKVAYLTESYEYYPNIDSDYYTFGKVNSFILKHKTDYNLKKNMLISGGLNFIRNSGKGSDIQKKKRHLGSAVLGIKNKINKTFFYELSVRQELNENYDSPFLYALGLNTSITSFYQVKLNASKNFRIPTYNDLYWQGLGNPDLKPELSYQAEMSHLLNFKDLTFRLTGHYNDVNNLLQWIPDINGVWRPENTERVEIYGLETALSASKKLNKHKFDVSATYAYTVSENKDTKKQLIYVPYHKLTMTLGYNYKRFSAYYQYINTGEVFTTTDNAPEHFVNSYMVANLGVEYKLFKKESKTQMLVGVQALNIWNEAYESIMNRPMPERNFQTYMNFNF